MVKHIKSADLFCAICENKSSQKGPVISCKNCCRGFHRECHRPVISDVAPKSWFCRRCASLPEPKKELSQRMIEEAIKKNLAQANPPLKNGKAPISSPALPTKDKVRWDSSHLTNCAQQYCYCKKDGFWMDKMIQCRSCRNWFHTGCIKALKKELMRGDHFYIFVCSGCKPQEFFQLLPFSWPELAYTAYLDLFFSQAPKIKRFLHLEETVLPHLNLHWASYRLPPEVARTPVAERKKKILEAMRQHDNWFKWGRDTKQSSGAWKLKVWVPPLCNWALPHSLTDSPALAEEAQRQYKLRETLFRYSQNPNSQVNGKRVVMMRGSVQTEEAAMAAPLTTSTQHNQPGRPPKKKPKLTNGTEEMPPIIRKRGRPFKKLIPLQAVSPQPRGRKSTPDLEQLATSPLEDLDVQNCVVKAMRVTTCGKTQYLLEVKLR